MDHSKPLENKKNKPWFLFFISLLSLGGLIYMISTINPIHALPYPFLSAIPTILLFFILLFFFCFSLSTFFLGHTRRGLLIALCICSYLLLRLNGITDPMFSVILLMVFITSEIFFSRIFQ